MPLCQPRVESDAGDTPATIAFTSTFSSVLGTGIVRNQNCPACKNLRRSGAALVGARRCAEIFSGGDHFQKDALRRFQVAGSITAPVASNILPKAVRSASRVS